MWDRFLVRASNHVSRIVGTYHGIRSHISSLFLSENTHSWCNSWWYSSTGHSQQTLNRFELHVDLTYNRSQGHIYPNPHLVVYKHTAGNFNLIHMHKFVPRAIKTTG